MGERNKEILIADKVYTAKRYKIYVIGQNTYLSIDNKTKFIGSDGVINPTNFDTYVLSINDCNNFSSLLIIDYYGNIVTGDDLEKMNTSLHSYLIELALKLLENKELYNTYKDNLDINSRQSIHTLVKQYSIGKGLTVYKLNIGKGRTILVDTIKNKILGNYVTKKQSRKDYINIFGRQLKYITHIDIDLDWTTFFNYDKVVKVVPTTLSYIKGGLKFDKYKILIGEDSKNKNKVICKVTNRSIKYIQSSGDIKITKNNAIFTEESLGDINKSITKAINKSRLTVYNNSIYGAMIQQNSTAILSSKINNAVNRYLNKYSPLIYHTAENKFWNIVDTDSLTINKEYIWFELYYGNHNKLDIVYLGISLKSNKVLVLETTTNEAHIEELL